MFTREELVDAVVCWMLARRGRVKVDAVVVDPGAMLCRRRQAVVSRDADGDNATVIGGGQRGRLARRRLSVISLLFLSDSHILDSSLPKKHGHRTKILCN